jgi:hypothetical protein
MLTSNVIVKFLPSTVFYNINITSQQKIRWRDTSSNVVADFFMAPSWLHYDWAPGSSKAPARHNIFFIGCTGQSQSILIFLTPHLILPTPLGSLSEFMLFLSHQLSGIQWGELVSLEKIQRKPLPHIKTGSEPIHWPINGSFHITKRYCCSEETQTCSTADFPCLSIFKKFRTKRAWLSLLTGAVYSIPPFCFDNWDFNVCCAHLTIFWPWGL